MDWTRPEVKELVGSVVRRVKEGEVILCHDIHPGTLKALPGIIDGVRRRGFSLVTMSFALERNTQQFADSERRFKEEMYGTRKTEYSL
jgi:peptidoglycan/xylan/chitin deacetylase (PgdA/CDA1 family)